MKKYAEILIYFSSLFVMISCAVSKSEFGSSNMSPTIYYKPTIILNKTKCTANELTDMTDPAGHILTTICKQDFELCLLQGSCFIEEQGKVKSFNYHSRIKGEYRFIEVSLSKCPYGFGVKGQCLDPYFSVAADLTYYSLGDVIFVPRLEGTVLPNGEVHDGYLIVRDTGTAIIGPQRFDFFTGFLNHLSPDNTFARMGFGDPKNKFEFKKVSEVDAKNIREKRNYPGIKTVKN